MNSDFKKILWFVLVVIVIIISLFVYFGFKQKVDEIIIEESPVIEESYSKYEVIGSSVENRKIESYSFGNGEQNLIFVGGIHGGYEWNSVLLAYQMIDYFELNQNLIPENLTVSIIPNANPDGVYKVIGKSGRFLASDAPAVDLTISGRFNANGVDLNRNFDCKWKPESTWRGKTVSAGMSAFSEPESVAIRDFVLNKNPESVIFWHSQASSVYASECENGILPETLNIMNLYSTASGYNPVASFDAYPISGDAEGWLASIGIPAITVELETHETIEFERNLSGVKKLLEYYSN